VLALRNILLESEPPPAPLLLKLTASSLVMFLLGLAVFGKLKQKFYDYL
jgi:ABC-type polysaccharide/polyol phosphate export permease